MVLNRKNSLFVGNARGGRTAAILASLTSTCRRHDMDPQLYLTQLLMNLPAARMNELSVWLPDQWKQLHVARIAKLAKAPPACCLGIGSPSAHDKAVHLGSKTTK